MVPSRFPLGLGPTQFARPANRYPGMSDLDTETWTAFLRATRLPITGVWYNVRVGDPIPTPPDATPLVHQLAHDLGCKRIDAVLALQKELMICEVKPYGTHHALGQILVYLELFQHAFPTTLPLHTALVCQEVDPDIRETLHHQGIWLYEFPSPTLNQMRLTGLPVPPDKV